MDTAKKKTVYVIDTHSDNRRVEPMVKFQRNGHDTRAIIIVIISDKITSLLLADHRVIQRCQNAPIGHRKAALVCGQ
jgi:hypothetical protein